MTGVYFQIRADRAKDAVQCGLKLSEHADREVVFPGETQPRPVMTAWLHPDDLPDRGITNGHVCLRLDVDPARCLVADADLYRMGKTHPVLMERFLSSLVPLGTYRFGTFRSPECLIPSSILDSQIVVLGRSLDVPVLYESSETLYLQTRMASYEEARRDNGNALFFAWCRMLSSKGLMERFVDDSGNREIFLSRETGSLLVLDVPEREDAEVWP
jgi:hypothetical protein